MSKLPMERMADSLEDIAKMMREDRDLMLHAQHEVGDYIDPLSCDHPRDMRDTDESVSPPRLGCSKCGIDDITKTHRRSA